jgi:hypothetical protein
MRDLDVIDSELRLAGRGALVDPQAWWRAAECQVDELLDERNDLPEPP